MQEEYNPRTQRFRIERPAPDPGICSDKNLKSCKEWAAKGECEKNPSYMKGTGIEVGLLFMCFAPQCSLAHSATERYMMGNTFDE